MLGLTFKENVPDLRNSKVVDVIARLKWLGHDITVHDPHADATEATHEYGLTLDANALTRAYDVVVAAVPHTAYQGLDPDALVAEGGLLADIKRLWPDATLGAGKDRWTL